MARRGLALALLCVVAPSAPASASTARLRRRGRCAGPDTPCRAAGTCQAEQCVGGTPVADGTPCPDADPCNGLETCLAGECRAGSGPPELGGTLVFRRRGRVLGLHASIRPGHPIAVSTIDAMGVDVRAGESALFSATLAHPASDPGWHRSHPPALFLYRDRRGNAGGLTAATFRTLPSGDVDVSITGRVATSPPPDGSTLDARVVIGDECFATTLRCVPSGRRLRCD